VTYMLRLAFVAEGDAETKDCWSGCAQGFVAALRRGGAHVDVVNAELRGWRRWMAAGASWHPDRRRWRQRFTLGERAGALKTAVTASALRHRSAPYHAIIQAGATFGIPRAASGGALRVLYADSNVRYAARGRPFSGVSTLDADSIERIAARERRIYDGADRIWTWSDALRDSFVDDFAQPREKLVTIYAGANLQAADAPAMHRPVAGAPSILFVGKDHRRKGSALLLEAFARVRREMADVELHIVGAVPEGADAPGVVAHGRIDTSRAEGSERLRALYERATVFCLPSRYEPFGVVFVEAMLASLPCIGTDRWAMPEIIEHGVTGWVAPDGDVGALAAILLQSLRDRERSATMGRRGRERALRLFTWDRVAARALADLAELRANASSPQHEATA
jgi:glycosyltransferase involved in cell wall biosynthesis